MNNKTFWGMSKYKKLALLLAIFGSGSYLFTPSNVAFAEEKPADNEVTNNENEVTENKSTKGNNYDDEIFPPEYLDFNQFVITADRTPVNKWATPANIITITDKDIEANHYQNLAEALNHVNGIIVPSLINVPIINGFEKVLILIDGHQLYNDGVDNRDTVELSAIPSMKNIKRIEIVKGGGSALYGSDAVTGVINIITKKGERNETTFDVNFGSWGQRNYEITNQGVRGDFSWFITGRINERGTFNYPRYVDYNEKNYEQLYDNYQEVASNYNNFVSDFNSSVDASVPRLKTFEAPKSVGEAFFPGKVNRADNPDSRESDFNDKAFTARFDYRFDDRNSITLSGHHISHKYSREYEYLFDPTSRDKSMTYNNVSLVYNFKENSQTPGWLRYFNDTKLREGYDQGRYDFYKTHQINGDRTSKFRVQGVDYQNSWIFGQNKIVTGLEWHQTKMEHWSWAGSEKISNTAVYLQDTISMGKKWKLIPGIRYDHNSEFGNQWSPKIAANYRADDQTKIYASWGRVYKAATPYQLYSRQHDYDYIDSKGERREGKAGKLGNKLLKPEKGHTAILGIEHDFGSKSSINFNIFYANLKDAIDYDVVNKDTPDEHLEFTNVKNEKSHGFEVTFKQKLNDDWSYDLGYNFTKVKGFDEVEGTFHQPRNTFSVGLHYNHGIWQANLLGIMGSGGLKSESFDSTNYAVLDFNVNCKVHENATIYLKLNNLTNQNYSYYAKIPYSTFISPGRSFILGADLKF